MAETQHFTSSGQIHPHGSGQTPGELSGAGWITLAAVMLFIAAPALLLFNRSRLGALFGVLIAGLNAVTRPLQSVRIPSGPQWSS